MSIEHTSGFCGHCQEKAVFNRNGANHILHGVLTLLSCGLWLPIWILSMVRFGGWWCSRCGTKA